MEAGKLRHRVSVVDPVETRSKSGGFKESKNTKRTVWAEVLPLAGRELVVAKQVDPRITMKVTVRGGTEIKQKDHLIFKGRKLEVEVVSDLMEIDRTIVLLCVEIG